MKTAVGAGKLFAGYRVDSLVGRGGMGVVYLARDESLERPVALKLIAPELLQDEEFRARFLREPKLAASLDHPNVIPIYEAGEHDGQLYLAMRYVKGTDLRNTLERDGKLSPERTIEILSQVAGALDAAHERGLVHRDVKPANVLLDEAGHPYLTDFGITKEAGGDPADTGQTLGTLDYLAPEQIRGEQVDGRTDGYALACVLYECLSGTPPFRQRTEAETLWAHMQGEPAPLRGRPELNRVLETALAKEKHERYASCSAFVEAAAEALGVEPPRTSARALAVRRKRLAGRTLVAGGLLLLVAAGAAAIATLGGDEAQEPPPQRNGIAAFESSGAQLASFTDTDTPPSSLAVGEGAVWALGLEGRTVFRVNPKTKKLVKRFRMKGPATDIAAGAGGVWVRPSTDDSTVRLDRLDPDTGKVTLSANVPGGEFAGDLPFQNWGFPQIAVGAGAVWAINDDHTVSRIDPATGELVARIDVKATTIAAGKQGVWVIDGEETRAVTRINTATNRRGQTIRVGAQNLSAVAVGGGHVWASAQGDGLVWRIDPGPDPVYRSIDVGVGVTFLAYGAGAIWAANYSEGTVARIDADTSGIESSPVGAVQSLAAGEGSAWVSSAGATSADGMPESCGELLAGRAEPDVLIASDFPLQGAFGAGPAVTADAVKQVLRQHDYRAGRYAVGYRSCDDSNEQSGVFDLRTCAANANAYAQAEQLVAVIGTYNSPCAQIEIPILNRAPGGAVPMISPSNTYPGLTRRGLPAPWGYRGEPGVFYPTGSRNYLRIPALDDQHGAADAILAKQLGLRSVYVLYDGSDIWKGLLSDPFRYAARRLGVSVAGASTFDVEAKGYDRLMDEIERSGAQGVVIGGDPYAGSDRVVRALRARFGSRLTIIGGFYFLPVPEVLDVTNGAARGMYVATGDVTRAQLDLTPAGKRFMDAFEGRVSKERTSAESVIGGSYILEAAQATELLLKAIGRSDGTRESVLKNLKASRVKNGILGDFRFDRNGDLTPAVVPIVHITGSTPRSARLPEELQGGVIDRVVEIPQNLIR
jgi:ABC-type branched-subunit amino acid transport system substrate-binding protein/outer membrane protein assembly factor BamB